MTSSPPPGARRLVAMLAAGRVALVEARLADLRQRAVRGHVLRAGVAVAEVAHEVEPQRVRQPCGLGDRLGVIGEAGGHRLRRGEHVGVVAAAQRLGGVERRVPADGDERSAAVPVGLYCCTCRRTVVRRPIPTHQPAVQRAVVRRRALQLAAEGIVPNAAPGASSARRGSRCIAAAEADQPA